MFFEQYLLLTV